MTNKDIKRAIKKCRLRNDKMVGSTRNDKYVICREHCLPCYEVIIRGQCETLKKLFGEERKNGNA